MALHQAVQLIGYYPMITPWTWGYTYNLYGDWYYGERNWKFYVIRNTILSSCIFHSANIFTFWLFFYFLSFQWYYCEGQIHWSSLCCVSCQLCINLPIFLFYCLACFNMLQLIYKLLSVFAATSLKLIELVDSQWWDTICSSTCRDGHYIWVIQLRPLMFTGELLHYLTKLYNSHHCNKNPKTKWR